MNIILRFLKKVANIRILPRRALLLRHKILASLGRKPILIYTMGKVGSTTVFHAFRKQYLFPLIYHVHHLTSESLKKTKQRYTEANQKIDGKVSLRDFQKGTSSHLSGSIILRKTYSERNQGKWNIVTLVRDPFSTYLSHLFQNPQISRPYLLGNDGSIDKQKVEGFINSIFTDFKPEKDYISNWFDREFLGFTGVDLYSYPFDNAKGYSIIHEKKFNIAVLRLETLNENLPKVVNEFVPGSSNITIEKKNVSGKDDSKDLYNKIKNEIRVSREGLEKFYSTKFAKHFFSEEHRSMMIKKWSGNLENVGTG